VKYICSVLLLLGSPVVAQEDDPFDVTLYGSFLHTEIVPNALFFFNEIEQYDGFELRRALRNHDIDTVVLASEGGNIFEGLNMAGIIHDKDIITYVPELPDEMGCYSACSFMFFGGKIRQADGVLAVHQAGAYGSDRDKAKERVGKTQQATQFTVSEIIGFLNEFETPPWVYEKMFRSRKFYEFDEEEKARLSSRADEIDPENLYNIDGFITAFFKHLEKLESEKKKADKPKEPELSDEEELRLVVREIQKLLNAAGCNAGVADGIWGRRTQAAAVLFAKTAKLPMTNSDLISESFIEKLRTAKANFCPKQIAKRPRVKFGDYYFKTSYYVRCAASNSKWYGKIVGTIHSITMSNNEKNGSFVLQFANRNGLKINFRKYGYALAVRYKSGKDRYYFTHRKGSTINSFPFSGFSYNGCSNFRAH
jgi:hypothetical protein